MKQVTCAIIGCIISGLAAVSGETLHVPAEYPTIQDAVDAADDGDTVAVAPGTYPENIVLDGKAITVLGTHGPEETLIDCQDDGRGFSIGSDAGRDTVIDGFTVRNGDANGGGGGISCWHGSPTIRNCIVENCRSEWDGGGIELAYSEAWIENCIIRNNHGFAEIDSAFGGGVSGWYSAPVLINCLITGNTMEGDEYTSSWGYAGGLFLDNTGMDRQPVVINCTVADNTVILGAYEGVLAYCSPIIVNCIFWNHITDYHGDTTHVTFSNMDHTIPGGGNIHADPLFVSDGSHDYLLSHTGAGQDETSPCVDTGSTLAELICTGPESDRICLDTMTTRTDGIVDIGFVDMGFHYRFTYPEPPTPTPEATPTPTATPTPESTPSPTPRDGLRIDLMIPDESLAAGAACYITARIDNCTDKTLMEIPFFCLLQMGDTFWYFPGMTTAPDWRILDRISPGAMVETVLPEFSWPGTGSPGYCVILAALTDPGMHRILGEHDIALMAWQ